MSEFWDTTSKFQFPDSCIYLGCWTIWLKYFQQQGLLTQWVITFSSIFIIISGLSVWNGTFYSRYIFIKCHKIFLVFPIFSPVVGCTCHLLHSEYIVKFCPDVKGILLGTMCVKPDTKWSIVYAGKQHNLYSVLTTFLKILCW